jgi:hypothetical protein
LLYRPQKLDYNVTFFLFKGNNGRAVMRAYSIPLTKMKQTILTAPTAMSTITAKTRKPNKNVLSFII